MNKRIKYRGQGNPNWKHGMAGTTFYSCWKHIKNRVYNKQSKDFIHYGGRGIKTDWDNFEDFKKDMFASYEEGLTIERINNNGNYCKENCKWATRVEQSKNTRRTRFITFNGKTLCLKDWAKELGMKRATLSNRINIYNWPVERALASAIK